MELDAFQDVIARTYGARDSARGIPSTIAWLCEEVGELAKAVRKGSRDEQIHELGDVVAWVASLAGQLGISLETAIERYARGCPRCGASPCACP
ncbi:MAG TPA: MazG nucleotide pyrophosphohydrolase domain-containing protein [Acidimicrobiia bacterium]